MRKYIYIISSILLFISCVHKQPNKEIAKKPDNQTNLTYAKGFSIQNFNNYKKVTVFSPWEKGDVYARYYLVNDDKTEVPTDGVKVKVPIKSIATASVTHLEFLNLLDEIRSITGLCNPKLAYNETVRQNFNTGKITDLGDPFSINVEKTLALKPDVLMMSGYNQTDANAQRLQQAGIPVIYNNEWMETTLLGRAEWIKFVAVFYGKGVLADSIFYGIEKNYNEIKSKAAKATTKPKIMAGSNFRGTWYMPSGQSFMGQLFKDAGGAYFYANDTTTGSLPLNVETVLRDFANTDVWLNCNFQTINELINADTKHSLFRPVKENKVYNFNKRILPSTANDFWESAVARPDLLLGDVTAILHPEIFPEWKLVYASKLTQ